MTSPTLAAKFQQTLGLVIGVGAILSALVLIAPAAAQSPGAGPVIVVQTVKGSFEFETYPEEAPRSVEHILRLVKQNFYRGLRIHRVEPKSIVQWGDPQTRNMTLRQQWGTGGSGKPVGVGEFSKTRTHVRGAVGMAHAGTPSQADSQLYIVLRNRPDLNGKYTVVGQVIAGIDIVEQLEEADVIRNMTVK